MHMYRLITLPCLFNATKTLTTLVCIQHQPLLLSLCPEFVSVTHLAQLNCEPSQHFLLPGFHFQLLDTNNQLAIFSKTPFFGCFKATSSQLKLMRSLPASNYLTVFVQHRCRSLGDNSRLVTSQRPLCVCAL